MTTYRIALPGKFAFFLSGSSVVQQGEEIHGYGRAGTELGAAFNACTPVRRGRGESYILDLTLGALDVLDDYAETCIDIYGSGDDDYAEMAAAQKVRDRIRAIKEAARTYTATDRFGFEYEAFNPDIWFDDRPHLMLTREGW